MAKRKDDTVRNRIIDASIQQFLAKGFVGTSVMDLANEVGIAKGTVYCHFKSKDDILGSILDKYAGEFLDGVIGEVDRCDGNFTKKFKVFYKYVTEFGKDHRDLMMVWHTLLGEIIGNRSETEKKMKEIQGRYTRYIETLIEQGKGEGLIGEKVDARIHARIILATLSGMLLQWYVEPIRTEENRAFARAFRDALLKGLEVNGGGTGSTTQERSTQKR